MKIFVAILLTSGLIVGAQQVPILDLSTFNAPAPTNASESVSGTVRSSSQLPLTLTLVEPIGQSYTVGTEFVFEVLITNNSQTAHTIPWSADRSWLNGVSESQVFYSAIMLQLDNGLSAPHALGGASMFGDSGSPSSVHVLMPGASVRVRATGVWSVSGLKIRDYLLQTNGAVTLRAKYFVNNGTNVAMSPLSGPRSVTLIMP